MTNHRVVVVTGGSSGIGLATARLFTEQAADIVIVGRDPDRLDAARADLEAATLATATLATAVVTPIAADLSRLAGVEKLVEHLDNRFGRVDVLFANAGTSDAPPILETTEHDFDQMINTNVKSVFFTIARALPLMPPGGSVIVTSSVAEAKGRPGDPLYAASKAAVRSLVRTLALDDAVLARGVRVNAVTPGTIATPLTAQSDPAMQEAIDAYVTSTVPLARWGTTEDVAHAVVFLADPKAGYITGTEIVVDGGLSQT